MPDYPIWRGFGLRDGVVARVRQAFSAIANAGETRQVDNLAEMVRQRLVERGLDTEAGRARLADRLAAAVLERFGGWTGVSDRPLYRPLCFLIREYVESEDLFTLPAGAPGESRAELWKREDGLQKLARRLEQLDAVTAELTRFFQVLVEPLVAACPALLASPSKDTGITFDTPLLENLSGLPEIVEHFALLPFVPELEEWHLTERLKDRLEYNLAIASGGVPGDGSKTVRLPTKSNLSGRQLADSYLDGTPFRALLDTAVPIVIPESARFEHQHIVAGSGHGKTQTLQHLILHDLESVAAGYASIIVIDSQSDLINTIASLAVFAPGGPLHDRLCLIDPTDIEYPVALNLFDMGQGRLDQYSALDRERLLNGILELYDFVLGSLLDAGMTQKQNVIFRYITRLLMHIPGATIHTLRELLEDDGYERYREHIAKLEGTARAFFETEFRGKEFVSTRRQVLRRLYGILENQTFERMFSHPKSKLDLYAEMNAGKVILINTAKDLLKENGTEIFGRFFIAMIAQAAQERATLPPDRRLPTFVYVDEASDYFDRTIGIILSQARKNKVGMVLSHQYLGQLEPKLLEAISANTAIKFAGGVSARDARALAADLRTDAEFIEWQSRLSFAAFVKGTTGNAVSISIPAGRMEQEPHMREEDRAAVREVMRARYAVHHTELVASQSDGGEEPDDPLPSAPEDDGKPMRWD